MNKHLRQHIKTLAVVAVFAALMSSFQLRGISNDAAGLLMSGDAMWNFHLPAPQRIADRYYLGLSAGEEFNLADIKAELLIVEILSVYCSSCQSMKPYMNEFAEKIERDPQMRGKVKIIGVGAGNAQSELDMYNKAEQVQFPLFPDPEFYVYELVKEPRTPFLLFVKPDGEGGLAVAASHLGTLKDADALYEKARSAFNSDISLIVAAAAKRKDPDTASRDLVLPVTEDDLWEKIRRSMASAGGVPTDIMKLDIEGEDTLYMGFVNDEKVFAKLVSRRIPCNDCHHNFFIIGFNDKGVFLDFVPVYIIKIGYKQWSDTEVKTINQRFFGKSVNDAFPFDPEVDAITSATVSTRLVYDTYNKAHLAFEKLVERGYAEK
ncbi:MAG: thiol-disulfide oxidoreductase [bacterium ADurb.Bin236]|nr:MAG: thiol-disulfide oxidoreductase [bacterium ADurb.Bin236]HOY62164.1 hypothetical protein [bacterium]HPN94670.1 hypothetical protein [bacterium]